MDAIITAFAATASLETFLAVLFGSVFGIVFGALPGLTFSMALALILPFTFAMEPIPSIGLLLGTWIGGMTGGSVAAILIGIPGGPSAAATVMDGYAMARQGKASLALGTAVVVSAFGGLFSLIVMMISVQLVSKVAISFGPAEIFALVIFGMSTICGLSERSILRGLIAGVIGLMIMTVGLDPLSGMQRLTFGSVNMMQGVDLLVAMIGLFAIPQVIETLRDYRFDGPVDVNPQSIKVELPSLKLLRENFGLMIRTSAIGTVLGAIPGAGGTIAAFLGYDHARRFAKDSSKFGKGDIRGLIGPEVANNAVTGGAMVTLVGLGIPADPATAIILGGLLIQGVQPGPLLFIEQPSMIYTLYIIIIAAYILVCLIQLYGVRIFVRTLMVPPHLLAVGILIMCVVGAYSIRNSLFDIYSMLLIGLIGYALMRVRIPVTPIVLGLVLGPTLEEEFRTALILSGNDPSIFYASFVSILFLVLALAVIAMQVVGQVRERGPVQKET